MTTITLSSTSAGMYSRCPTAYRTVYVLDRRPVGKGSGLIAGTAIHAPMPLLLAGKPVAEQEAAVDAVLTQTPIPASEKEYRTAGYIKDALAAFRAEHASTFAHWTIEEVEQQGIVELGEVTYTLPQQPSSIIEPYPYAPFRAVAKVLWEFRRDLVGVDPDGRRWIVDWKTSAREEEAQIKAMQNSGQFMGYIASWQIQHPDKPVAGVQPIRIIMRKPYKNGVNFGFPKDGGLFFSQARIDEWKRHTLRKARELLERDPQDADAWPMAATELGCCRHTYGCCEFIGVCVLDPAERALKLSTDEFESAKAAKARDRGAKNGDEP